MILSPTLVVLLKRAAVTMTTHFQERCMLGVSTRLTFGINLKSGMQLNTPGSAYLAVSGYKQNKTSNFEVFLDDTDL